MEFGLYLKGAPDFLDMNDGVERLVVDVVFMFWGRLTVRELT